VSTSEQDGLVNDFERWIASALAKMGAFTMLVVLVEIVEKQVTPMCSTWFNIATGDIEWSDIVVAFAGAGREWHGAAFFPVVASDGGPVDNPTARLWLHDLERKIDDDLLALNEGGVFDRQGRRMQVEKETLQCASRCP
jgi:hypothetical protein